MTKRKRKNRKNQERLFELPEFDIAAVEEATADEFYSRHGFRVIAGVDEAGRGALAGPVSAAAVILGKLDIKELGDSKTLKPEVRLELYDEIMRSATAVGVAMVGPMEVDRKNVLNASLYAMSLAVDSMPVKPDIVLVDGNKVPVWGYPSVAIVKGDSKSKAIMAASIVAKVTRDNYMINTAKEFPDFNFDKHKGYSVKAHLEAIDRFGITHIHRLTFYPCSLYHKELRTGSDKGIITRRVLDDRNEG